MARLFKNQEDLLSEFGQFLPDANSSVVSTLGYRIKYLVQTVLYEGSVQKNVVLLLLSWGVGRRSGG